MDSPRPGVVTIISRYRAACLGGLRNAELRELRLWQVGDALIHRQQTLCSPPPGCARYRRSVNARSFGTPFPLPNFGQILPVFADVDWLWFRSTWQRVAASRKDPLAPVCGSRSIACPWRGAQNRSRSLSTVISKGVVICPFLLVATYVKIVVVGAAIGFSLWINQGYA